jgi:hypothetical protein
MTPWSHFSWRLPAPYGEVGCATSTALGASLSIRRSRKLGISGSDLDDIFKEIAFGAAWSVIEDRSPLFARRSLRPELPEQITFARRSLSLLRKGGSSGDNNPGTQGFSVGSLAYTEPLD